MGQESDPYGFPPGTRAAGGLVPGAAGYCFAVPALSRSARAPRARTAPPRGLHLSRAPGRHGPRRYPIATADAVPHARSPQSPEPGAGDSRERLRSLAPPQARELIRAGACSPTAGWALGHTQVNLIAVPADWAYDVLLFCTRNPKPCPVLDVTDPGARTTALAPSADLRTDFPRYRVWEDGRLVGEPVNASAHWREDLVCFLIGCSFTFETALADAGIPLRHVEQRRNVAMYVTNRRCRPAGRLHGPMVVSMRPVPAGLAGEAARISGRMPAVHGAPVHTGDPAALGIEDLSRPDFGDPVEAAPGDVPMFWACGVTPQAALTASRPPFAITHAPGYMLITDARDTDYRVL